MPRHEYTKALAVVYGRQGGLARKGHAGESTLKVREAKLWLREQFLKDKEKWYRALKDSGMGHYEGTQLPDGTMVDVYTKAPNVEAIKEVLNRALGKVPLSLEVESDQPFAINTYALTLIQPMLDPDDPEDAAFIIREDVGTDDAEGGAGDDDIVPALEAAAALVWDDDVPAHHQEPAGADTPRPDPAPDQPDGRSDHLSARFHEVDVGEN